MTQLIKDFIRRTGYFLKKQIKGGLRSAGFDFVRYSPVSAAELDSLADLTEPQKEIIGKARPFTMTSVERMAALMNAVNYICQNNITGDITECGVWRGGSMMVIASTLLANNDKSRTLYLFDTFEGMSAPTEADKSADGVSAQQQLDHEVKGHGVWCYASIEDVRANLVSTGYPQDKIQLIKGKVEDTIPRHVPSGLALLRLDTDWYESTKHELEHLYPLLQQRGVLIIDDYGHWQGARKAVDEYFALPGGGVFLHRIDYTGRIMVK